MHSAADRLGLELNQGISLLDHTLFEKVALMTELHEGITMFSNLFWISTQIITRWTNHFTNLAERPTSTQA